MTQVIALERKAKNDPGLKAYFWRLVPSWKLSMRPNRQKDRSSVIENMQNPYTISIF